MPTHYQCTDCGEVHELPWGRCPISENLGYEAIESDGPLKALIEQFRKKVLGGKVEKSRTPAGEGGQEPLEICPRKGERIAGMERCATLANPSQKQN